MRTALASAIQGAGISGLMYDAKTFGEPQTFSWSQLGVEMMNGFFTGAVSGGLGAYAPGLSGGNVVGSMLQRAAFRGVVGGIARDVGTLLTDVETGQKPTFQGLAASFGIGFGLSGATQLGKDFASRGGPDAGMAILRRVARSSDAATNRARQALITNTVRRGLTLMNKAKGAAKTDAAVAVYAVSGGALLTSWIGYGATHHWGEGSS